MSGPGFSRRGLLGAGLAAAGAGVGAVAGVAGSAAATGVDPFAAAANGDESLDLSQQHPFYATGPRQPQGGIRTVPQRHCVFMVFDLSSTVTTDLQVLLARWSAAIAQLQAGRTVGSVEPAHGDGVGADTGEALDLGAASLTVTRRARTRCLRRAVSGSRASGRSTSPTSAAAERPARGRADRRRPVGAGLCGRPAGGVPRVRDLARMARGTATVRWTVIGFGRASAGPSAVDPAQPDGLQGRHPERHDRRRVRRARVARPWTPGGWPVARTRWCGRSG